LEDEVIIIEENDQLNSYIIEYYKNLFGKEPVSPVHLHKRTWAFTGRIDTADYAMLTKAFTNEEIDEAVKLMKTNTVTGPNGFPVQFLFLKEEKALTFQLIKKRVVWLINGKNQAKTNTMGIKLPNTTHPRRDDILPKPERRRRDYYGTSKHGTLQQR
jgi:hypothetical protein